ncbi:MAG TPA: 3-keto-5-aminohexanoate cleavage protein [Candidatus Acidoferrales bacterium]
MIQVALNGARAQSENAAIPFTVEEMVGSTRAAAAAGAECVHFHVRAAGGAESIQPEDVATSLNAMRHAIPGFPLGISTAEWIVPDSAERHQLVSDWTVLPDFASVNFNEPGSVALAEMLLARGVGIESGLGSVLAVENFVGSGLGNYCLRALLEPEQQEMSAAAVVVGLIEAFLIRGGIKIPRLAHGYENTAWDFIGLAAARKYDTRIGFEDTVVMPDGAPAPGNAAIIAEAVRITRSLAKGASAT